MPMRVSTLGGCGMQQQQRYMFASMVRGVNPLLENEISAVVYTVGGEVTLNDFTVPERPASVAVQFDMKIDIPYEQCEGPEKEAACKQNMGGELQSILGAPADMIEIL